MTGWLEYNQEGAGDAVCLMCCEKLAKDCHRKLIAEYLAEHKGVEIYHIE